MAVNRAWIVVFIAIFCLPAEVDGDGCDEAEQDGAAADADDPDADSLPQTFFGSSSGCSG